MKKQLLAVSALIVALGLTACGKPAETPKAADAGTNAQATAAAGGLIGLAIPEATSERWKNAAEFMKKELEAKGYKVEIGYGDGDQSKQNKQIEDFITKGAKVVVVGAVNDSVAQAVDSAKAAGVQVIAFDRLIKGTDQYDYYMTFDNFKVGAFQGEAIKAALDLDKSKGKNITLFAGASTDNNARVFFDGAWSVLKPYVDSGALNVCGPVPTDSKDPNWTKIATPDWANDKAKARMETLISGDCKSVTLDAVLAPNDGLARAIIGALEQSGKYKTLPFVTGQDAELLSVKWINEGKQGMTVFKDDRFLAKATAEAADALVKGQKPAPTVKFVEDTTTYNTGKKNVNAFLLEPLVVNKANTTSAMVDSGFYTAEQVAKGTK